LNVGFRSRHLSEARFLELCAHISPRRATPPSAANKRVWASNSILWPWLGLATSQNAREPHSFMWATCTR
jgi:hypothetical protein